MLDLHPSADIVRSRSARAPLIVFCHLRWGFVFQRPQHLLTRLAERFDIFVVEEPQFLDGEPRLESAQVAPGIEVLTPRTPERAPGFDDRQLPWISKLLEAFTADRGIQSPLTWLYTPMALPLAQGLKPRAVVYDCMDDLASFKFAPAALVERELDLLKIADVVLTGGPSLYEARSSLRPDVQCLPSAVDIEHFSPGRLIRGSVQALAAEAVHADLSVPRLGFFGVIDERIDLALIADVAERRPDWQLVMAGPVVKIDPATLPQRPNIRWLGMQSYDTLPYLLAHWDVAILPFALNEATRFISPTKTLEYLAGGRPVVSTPIHDVVSLYGSVVRIASTPAEFVDAAAAAMIEPAEQRRVREAEARAIMSHSTWDVAADRVLTLLRHFIDPAIENQPRKSIHTRTEGRVIGLPIQMPEGGNQAVATNQRA